VREVVIVDNGGANLASLQYALKRLGARGEVSANLRMITNAERVLLPGVGAAGQAMRRLRASGLSAVLKALTQPVLGVCLGMQLLFERSEEGDTECLGLLPYPVRHISPVPGRPVPHAGWNMLRELKPDPLLDGVAEGDFAYFVHSYSSGVTPCTLAIAEYGTMMSAVVRRGNFWGTQFHPERSSSTGTQILQNFLRL
jgi:imidazole glycerol-phosphate synthase subunit HisH